MAILLPFLLETISILNDITSPDAFESSSSNPGLVIGSAILVVIIIGGTILHTYSPEGNHPKKRPPKIDLTKED